MYLSQIPRSSILNIAIIVLTLPRARAESLHTYSQQTRARYMYTCIVPPAVEKMPLPLSRACLITFMFFWTSDNLAFSQESAIFVWTTTDPFMLIQKTWLYSLQHVQNWSKQLKFILLLWLENTSNKLNRKYSIWNQYISFYKLGSQKRVLFCLAVHAFSLPISPIGKFHLKKTWIRFTCAFRFNKFDFPLSNHTFY